MTLVEVVAGLALLGSVLVSLLLAKGALSRQRIEADRRLEAIAVADEMLARWQTEGTPVPRHASGRAGLDDRFAWQTRIVGRRRVAGLEIDVVRLEVTGNTTANAATPDGPRRTLAEVEMLMPPPVATKKRVEDER